MAYRLKTILLSSLLCAVVTASALALDTSQLNQTAVHEASHAVAAFAQGGWVNQITIFPNLGGECECFHWGHREMGIIALAGFAGQRVILHTQDTYGASVDFDIGAHVVGGTLFFLLPQTEQLINQNQAAILAIAEELKMTRRMSGDRAWQIFQNAGIARGPIAQQTGQTTADVSQADDCPTPEPPSSMYGMVMAGLVGALAVLAAIAKVNGY